MLKSLKRTIVNFISSAFGAGLTANQKTVLWVICTLYIGVGLSGTFVNIFLYKTGDGLHNVLVYNTYYYISIALMSVAIGIWSKKIGPVTCIQLGLGLFGLMYLLLLIFQDNAVKYSWLIGIVGGFAAALFHVAYNSVVFRITGDRGRDYYMAVQGLILALVALIAPISAGVAIEYIGGIKGYLIIFSVTLLVLILSGIISVRLPRQRLADTKSYFLSVVLMPFRRKSFANVTIGETVRGFREGAMFFMAIMFLYEAIPNTAVIGIYTFMCSALQIYANLIVQKHMRPGSRKGFLAIGAIAAVVSGVLFLFGTTWYLAFLYGIISSVTLPFYGTSTATIYYYAMSKMPASNKRSLEGMATREFYLNAGRVVGIVGLLFLPMGEPIIMRWAMAVLGLSQLIVWYFFNRADQEHNSVASK